MTTKTASITLTDDNFQPAVLLNPQPVLVDFWAVWCGPCRVMGPIIDELAEEFTGRVTVGKVNVDDAPHLAAQYDIRSIPTFLVFQDGRVVDRAVGVVPKQVLVAKLARCIQTA